MGSYGVLYKHLLLRSSGTITTSRGGSCEVVNRASRRHNRRQHPHPARSQHSRNRVSPISCDLHRSYAYIIHVQVDRERGMREREREITVLKVRRREMERRRSLSAKDRLANVVALRETGLVCRIERDSR